MSPMMARIERARWVYVQAVDLALDEFYLKGDIRILREGLPVGASRERIREFEELFAPRVFPDELVDLWLHAGVGLPGRPQNSTSLFGSLGLLTPEGVLDLRRGLFDDPIPECMVPVATYSKSIACVEASTEPAATGKVWVYQLEDRVFAPVVDSLGEYLDFTIQATEAWAVSGEEDFLSDVADPKYNETCFFIDEPSEWPESWGPPRQI